MSDQPTSSKKSSLSALLDDTRALLVRYKVLLFVLLLAAVYGFVCFKVYSLSSQADNQAFTSSGLTSVNPHIDESVAKRLESLQDNSVNVQTLFNDARNNPFSQ